jgi:hypothetical protein
MAGKQGIPLFRERIIVGAVPCTISAYVKDTTYCAAWVCGACSKRSELAFEGTTPNAAIRSAKADFAAHLAAMHTRSPR